MNFFTTFTNVKDGNVSYDVGDKKLNVDKNRLALSKKYGFKLKNLRYMKQVHESSVKIVNKNSSNFIKSCDGLITNEKNLPLLVMVADCIPILFYDKKLGVIAAVHGGRNSTFLGISSKTVYKMIKNFNCKKEDIKVIFGPSIQKCCYEVDDELLKIVKKSFGKEFIYEKRIDLQGINKKQLNDVGIFNIDILKHCTKCTNNDYFSYRRSKNTGRFAGIIELRD